MLLNGDAQGLNAASSAVTTVDYGAYNFKADHLKLDTVHRNSACTLSKLRWKEGRMASLLFQSGPYVPHSMQGAAKQAALHT